MSLLDKRLIGNSAKGRSTAKRFVRTPAPQLGDQGGNLTKEHLRAQLRSATLNLVLPILLFVGPSLSIFLFQYAYHGYERVLGWDTSTYVWWARLVDLHGAEAMVQRWNYPNLYTLTLSSFGALLASTELAAMILPFIVALPLGYAYFWLTKSLTSSYALGLLAAFLGGCTLNTVRMLADLHRNLLAFSIALPLGAAISLRLLSGQHMVRAEFVKRALLWTPLLAIVAYAQMETYAVLAGAILIVGLFLKSWRAYVATLILLALPLLVAGPLFLGFFNNYLSQASGTIQIDTRVTLYESWLYLGGFLIAFLVLGLVRLVVAFRKRNPFAIYICAWLLSLTLLLPVSLFLGLPASRVPLLVPVPIIVVLGGVLVADWVRSRPHPGAGLVNDQSTGSGGRRHVFLRTAVRFRTREVSMGVAVAAVIVSAISTTVFAGSQYLQPYVSSEEVQRIRLIGQLAQTYGYSDPIIVLYGPRAAYFAPIFRAYLGHALPDSLAYYGRVQYVFSLPVVDHALTWKYNPPSEAVYSVTYRNEILAAIRSPSQVSSRAVLLAGGGTYDAPLTEAFLSRFHVGNGMYMIPPHSLFPEEVDTWRLLALVDRAHPTPGHGAKVSWSQSPEILEWVDLGPGAEFEATYLFSLLRPWGLLELGLRLWDWTPTTFGSNGTAVTYAPLDVLIDGKLIARHEYGGRGPIVLNLTAVDIDAGLHTIQILSRYDGSPVAVRLDEITILPTASVPPHGVPGP